MTKINRVFLSYSHDSDDHKSWVEGLATFLTEQGLEVVFDIWDVDYGDDLPKFMEKSVTESDRIVIVCTDAYIAKANAGEGGVGYEKTIVTAEILNGVARNKIVPVVRNVEGEKKVPTFVGAALYCDLSDGTDSQESRKDLLRNLHGVKKGRPAIGTNPFAEVSGTASSAKAEEPIEADADPEESLPERRPSRVPQSTAFFSDAFARAFPGLRGTDNFTGHAAQTRLEVLLSNLQQDSDYHPIWWWRGGASGSIDNFDRLEPSKHLMNVYELRIAKVTAANEDQYYQQFVYVECEADTSTGLYPDHDEYIRQNRTQRPYWAEEFGIVDDGTLITRAEYDDAGTVIDGMPVDLSGRTKLRVRYLTPYNFLISAQASPLNNPDFDRVSKPILDGMLAGTAEFSELLPVAMAMKKRF